MIIDTITIKTRPARSKDKVAGAVRGWTIRGSSPGKGKQFPSSLKLPDHLLGPPSLLLWRYREFFSQRLALELTSHFSLVSRLRVSGAVLLLPIYAFMQFTATGLPFVSLTTTSVQFSFFIRVFGSNRCHVISYNDDIQSPVVNWLTLYLLIKILDFNK